MIVVNVVKWDECYTEKVKVNETMKPYYNSNKKDCNFVPMHNNMPCKISVWFNESSRD